jgi:hypothetical protein
MPIVPLSRRAKSKIANRCKDAALARQGLWGFVPQCEGGGSNPSSEDYFPDSQLVLGLPYFTQV